ncbi:cytochrome c biogenesis protein ResB [Microbacterium caowuchunii]|uniref:Cytochrome c biogenesis protein ResB n=1 Tax=Microbacterium caowuchunii TaxID=2614638 RepID=A0A5N0TFK0_9MICO|nr:cytochrome c biogenesis protein ResB [Microbacterium caowuchunii]KAA9133800.1 cytochrome c biogenesis protein ResB [Microbacterium caowuchunii]
MSRLRSDDRTTDPLRPTDHVDGQSSAPGPDASADGDGTVTGPKLGLVEWLRWGWRQLTSMRTALVLLLLLAIAAIPGSIFPQRSADPNGVTQYRTDNPDLFPILDGIQLFDVYSSVWFSSIYILLFISLIGCVIPRAKHHWKALRALPPRTPARLSRLDDHRERTFVLPEGADAAAEAERAIEIAGTQLRGARYRVHRYDGRGSLSVSAERGYLRETGNLIFHIALVGVLIAVGVGGALTYTGQRAIVQGQSFVNALTDYSSFNPGRFVDPDNLPPYSIVLDRFDLTYQPAGSAAPGQAGDFVAHVTTQLPGEEPQQGEVRVNHPLDIAGDRIYLMGNGYAPTITVRDAEDTVIFHDNVPFLPQDNNMTSLGVVKIADGLPEQVGLVGFFYPTMQELDSGAFTSVYPDLVFPVLTLNVYAGDLGIDDGTPRSVYTLDPTGMTQLTGGQTGVDSIQLLPGQSAELPDGLGSITFENAADPTVTPTDGTVDASTDAAAGDYTDAVKRFVSLSIHRDVGAPWVLLFAVLALGGLLLALFVPRRRMWVRITPDAGTLRVEYAALARGEDPQLAVAIDQLAARHAQDLQKELGAISLPTSAESAAAPGPAPESSPKVD